MSSNADDRGSIRPVRSAEVSDRIVRSRVSGWAASYRRNIIRGDFLIIVAVVVSSQSLRFNGLTRVRLQGMGGLDYWAVSVLLSAFWMLALALYGAWDVKTLGAGPSEYRRVGLATFAVITCTALFAYLTRTEIARGYLALAFPLGTFGLLGGRWVWRLLLKEHRRAGTHLDSVLVIGGRVSAPALAARLRMQFEAGYRVVGLCLPGGVLADGTTPAPRIDGFDVLGGVDHVLTAVGRSGADTIAVAASGVFGPEQIRRLAWDLEGSSIRMVLAPALTDVAGPRIHVEPVAGLPLLDVEAPKFTGPKLFAKTMLDYVIGILGVVLLAPIFALTTCAILVTMGRPVFYRPHRIGQAGRSFKLFRFRSMTRDGARITRVGQVIRRLGIDQSAQLLNVVAGQMGIVGTRPIDPEELVLWDMHLERRLRLKPGMTGPSQVLGRSNISLGDQLQLDLRYLENWTISGDLVMIVRALFALFRRRWREPATAPIITLDPS